jgi:hypothetical protein
MDLVSSEQLEDQRLASVGADTGEFGYLQNNYTKFRSSAGF